MHYVTLSWHKYAHENKRLRGIFILLVTGGVRLYTQNLWLTASAFLRNIAVFSALHTLQGSLDSRVHFNPIVFFRAGDALFSVFFVLSFISSFIGRNTDFDLSCSDIRSASTKVITYTQERFDF